MVLYFTLPATMYRIYTVRYIHSYVLAALNLYSGGTSARYSLLDPILEREGQ